MFPPETFTAILSALSVAGTAILEGTFKAASWAELAARAEAWPDLKWEFLARAAAKTSSGKMKVAAWGNSGSVPYMVRRHRVREKPAVRAWEERGLQEQKGPMQEEAP